MSGDGRTLISVDEGILNVAFVLSKVSFYNKSCWGKINASYPSDS